MESGSLLDWSIPSSPGEKSVKYVPNIDQMLVGPDGSYPKGTMRPEFILWVNHTM